MSATSASPDRKRERQPGRRAVEGVLHRLKARMEEGDDEAVTIGDAVEAIGTRGFGPVFLALALLVASPFGGIPTVPTIFAAMLAILAGQMVIGRQSLYVPGIFARRGPVDGHGARCIRGGRLLLLLHGGEAGRAYGFGRRPGLCRQAERSGRQCRDTGKTSQARFHIQLPFGEV